MFGWVREEFFLLNQRQIFNNGEREST